jgi:prolyl oligopeptidase
MDQILDIPPHTVVEPVTDIFHGVPVRDPYRWLEDQRSPRTREWIQDQTRYARSYLGNIPGRERAKERIRELLSVETYDSVQLVGKRYFFRKRLPNQEQPCICMRQGPDGEDRILVDPGARGTGQYTAVNITRISWDGRLLAYEVKQGGEESLTLEIIDVESRQKLNDGLPHGFLFGFAFAPDSRSYFYSHEPLDARRPCYRAAYRHLLGSDPRHDAEVFVAGQDPNSRVLIRSDEKRLGFLICKFGHKTEVDFYVQCFDRPWSPVCILERERCVFNPMFCFDRIFAITDKQAPNLRIVELVSDSIGKWHWRDVVPETDARIFRVVGASGQFFVSYVKGTSTYIAIHSPAGQRLGEVSVNPDDTVRLIDNPVPSDELLCESESFTRPIALFSYLPNTKERKEWAARILPFDGSQYNSCQIHYTSKDGTRIPMFLVGRRDILADGRTHPAILTSYGGFGACMTPQFSVFVAFMIERGCLFALPNIRGGSEFGAAWHEAAKKRNRQNAYDDFLSAAEWLISSGRTSPDRLAIFGGSNSGLLVGAALTQRPDLFRAVVCFAPLLDMLRYHLFDFTVSYIEEFGTADIEGDFAALSSYSPYHRVQDGTKYPAVLIISGDADTNCNPLHARKMTARLQAANISQNPILLDYKEFRGHSPVLPLSERIDGLTDRLAFLSDQLGIVL